MYIIRYRGKNNKIIWKLSNYLRYFPKKKLFFSKILASNGSATGGGGGAMSAWRQWRTK